MIKKRLYRGSKDIPFHIELVQLKEIEKEANGPHCSPEKKFQSINTFAMIIWELNYGPSFVKTYELQSHELDGKTMIKLVNIYFEDQRSLDLKMCICGCSLNENQISVWKHSCKTDGGISVMRVQASALSIGSDVTMQCYSIFEIHKV